MQTKVHSMILLFLLAMLTLPSVASAEPVRVAAASDLKFALEELAANYTLKTDHQLSLTFGSSGVLATQIRHGAPFQLFLSADESYITDLHASGLMLDAGKLYALGRIVLIAPKNGKLKLDADMKGLADMLNKRTLSRFAIANPEHAPYGKRAEEALRSKGLWQSMQAYLLMGENVSQAAQFAISGSADGGIVALSLVKASQLGSRVNYILLPEKLHQPLRQRMALTNQAGDVAIGFYRYLQQPEARAVFKRYGFDLPEGSQ